MVHCYSFFYLMFKTNFDKPIHFKKIFFFMVHEYIVSFVIVRYTKVFCELKFTEVPQTLKLCILFRTIYFSPPFHMVYFYFSCLIIHTYFGSLFFSSLIVLGCKYHNHFFMNYILLCTEILNELCPWKVTA